MLLFSHQSRLEVIPPSPLTIHTHRLQQLHSLNLLEPIYCISVVLDYHSKLCTHLLVGLTNGKLIIVSVKEAVTQAKPA